VKSIYKFIAGNSRVTPIAVPVAAIVAFVLHGRAGGWDAVIYLALLVTTLAACTYEPVQ
jgi:hypothetical protein